MEVTTFFVASYPPFAIYSSIFSGLIISAVSKDDSLLLMLIKVLIDTSEISFSLAYLTAYLNVFQRCLLTFSG